MSKHHRLEDASTDSGDSNRIVQLHASVNQALHP